MKNSKFVIAGTVALIGLSLISSVTEILKEQKKRKEEKEFLEKCISDFESYFDSMFD